MGGGRRAAPFRSLASRLALATALAGAGAAASAAGLQVTPTTLTLSRERPADALWLSNTGQETLRAQVRVFRWTQNEGQERLEPDPGLAISPPMLELAPGARQLVRVIRLGAPPAREGAYRLIVDELPPAQTPEQTGLQFVLRYSVPVFLAPLDGAAGAPQLRAQFQFEGAQAWLSVDNRGDRRAQLADAVFVDAQGARHALAPGLLGYALAGQRMRWPLRVPADPLHGAGTLKARINGEPNEQALALDPPAR
ncbi:fimbrial biogenesis chaperone [Lysobacter enzymogenes]|uniref:fimbrial biogenesis chaperone n=1 Tax=Lysobacter enzymogenes TaxID=69 RepID=UPI001A96E0AE|nr:fimbria/pilus periplasmic chaperone [Lysobacter enzymogenes]QQP95047.1 molecular chaperone [Lysobacter enzymogenes]